MITPQSDLIKIRPTSFRNEVYSRLTASATSLFCRARMKEREIKIKRDKYTYRKRDIEKEGEKEREGERERGITRETEKSEGERKI